MACCVCLLTLLQMHFWGAVNQARTSDLRLVNHHVICCVEWQSHLFHLSAQASDADELQQLQTQLKASKQAERDLKDKLAEVEAAVKKQEEQGQQAERQLSQMVESQRRLGQELQEGVEAREDAEAQRDQAQVGIEV